MELTNHAGLVGGEVSLVFSDPWELSSLPDVPPHRGRVVLTVDTSEGSNADRVIIKLTEPILYNDLTIEYLVVRNRHGAILLPELLDGGGVLVNILGGTEEPSKNDILSDISWEPDLLAIGTITLNVPA